MADHLDAPGLMSPGMDARIDITDVYAFQKPGDQAKSILVLNVNPLAPTLANEFESGALYEINVDTNGDAITDVAFRITFTPKVVGMQKGKVRVATGSDAARLSASGDVIIDAAPVSFGSEAVVTTGVHRVHSRLLEAVVTKVDDDGQPLPVLRRVPKRPVLL